ncbi:unnamed protein product, partial [Vitis vinifera]|uniref:Uncharacterized protein n=1 Tax=Vitis vinifera TaxID=29760 RepID=D7SMY9_VITVI
MNLHWAFHIPSIVRKILELSRIREIKKPNRFQVVNVVWELFNSSSVQIYFPQRCHISLDFRKLVKA